MPLFFKKNTATASFYCAECKSLAGTVELLPKGHAEGLSKEVDTIFVSGFIGTEKVVLSTRQSQGVRVALEQTDVAALYQVQHLFAPFYCPTCDCVYCVQHWKVIPQYDEGFFDCSYGWCPKGHRRMLED